MAKRTATVYTTIWSTVALQHGGGADVSAGTVLHVYSLDSVNPRGVHPLKVKHLRRSPQCGASMAEALSYGKDLVDTKNGRLDDKRKPDGISTASSNLMGIHTRKV